MINRRAAALSILVLQAFAAVAAACPMCKDTIATDSSLDGPTPGIPGGFKVSIYLMLGGVFAVMGLVGGIIVKGVRSGNRPAQPPGGFPVNKSDR